MSVAAEIILSGRCCCAIGRRKIFFKPGRLFGFVSSSDVKYAEADIASTYGAGVRGDGEDGCVSGVTGDGGLTALVDTFFEVIGVVWMG